MDSFGRLPSFVETYVDSESVIFVRSYLLMQWLFHDVAGLRFERELSAIGFADSKRALRKTEGQFALGQHFDPSPAHHRTGTAGVVDQQFQSGGPGSEPVAGEQVDSFQLRPTWFRTRDRAFAIPSPNERSSEQDPYECDH